MWNTAWARAVTRAGSAAPSMRAAITPCVRDHHVVTADDGTGAGDAAPDALLELEVPARQVQTVEQRADLVDVRAGIDQRPQGHVARDAGEAVEPGQRRRTGGRVGHGSIRATAQAAP